MHFKAEAVRERMVFFKHRVTKRQNTELKVRFSPSAPPSVRYRNLERELNYSKLQ